MSSSTSTEEGGPSAGPLPSRLATPTGGRPAYPPDGGPHPPGLKIIFMTEMWERFSYYGMRALLVLYLVNAAGMQREDALHLYGLYTGLVYLTPLVGGAIADRWLGARRAAVIGAAIMMLGHFAMAFPSLLNLALGLLIVGNGFFKPNTTAMVGLLYAPDDPRRAGGYTIFYMGVNVGAFLAPLVAGTLGESVGWHWGFASAGVGMAIGLVVLCSGQHLLGSAGLREGQGPLGWRDTPLVAGWCIAAMLLVQAVLTAAPMLTALWSPLPLALKFALGIGAALGLGWLALRQPDGHTEPLTKAERGRVLAIAITAFFVVFFWMGYEQAGGSMTLFADTQTDRHAFGWEIPASWFQTINPAAIVLLAPAFAAFWTWLDRSRYALPDPAKQACGMLVLGLGFVLMVIAQSRAEQFGSVGPQWLATVYLLHAIGELMLSPVGLSQVSRIAPPRLLGLLMGVWLMANAVANYLAGALEGLLAGSGVPLYVFLLGSSLGAGALLLALSPWIQRLASRRD
ncbi:MAG: peptide MFS transporter [Pseudomonadota bacterium]